MRASVLATLTTLILQSCLVAQVPKVVITGPASRAAGQLVIIKTTGTLGSDPKVDCSPSNDDWMAVKFQDDTAGIMFSTNRPGKYTFFMAVNSGGKTALGQYAVEITGPEPPGPTPGPTPGPGPKPPGDDFGKALQNAYSSDLAAGNGTKDSKELLAANYRQAPDVLFPKCKTLKDLQDAMRAANDGLVGVSTLSRTRDAVAADVLRVMGDKPADPLDPVKAKVEWLRVAEHLDQLP